MSKIFVTEPMLPDYNEYIKEIEDLFINKWITNNGEKHKLLEQKLKEYLKVKNISLFCNGHMALYSILNVLDLKGEVITTPFTFASTTHAIVQNNLKPVFCDINYDDYTIDTSKIEKLINKNTKAILPVHVYGNPCDVDKINEIASNYKLKVIYDAAHAFNVKINDKSICNYGDASMLSFHATKVFNTIEGGAIICNDEIKEKLDLFKNFGIKNNDTINMVGLNAKMNEFSASMGICNLKNIKKEIEIRKKIVKRYLYNLNNLDGIKLPYYKSNIDYNYSYFPILILNIDRNIIIDNLSKEDIYVRKYFYPLTSDYECYNFLNNTPIASKVSNSVITLPLYSNLSLKDVDKICNIIIDSLKNKKYEKKLTY